MLKWMDQDEEVEEIQDKRSEPEHSRKIQNGVQKT